MNKADQNGSVAVPRRKYDETYKLRLLRFEGQSVWVKNGN
jgi:hypothetical protein